MVADTSHHLPHHLLLLTLLFLQTLLVLLQLILLLLFLPLLLLIPLTLIDVITPPFYTISYWHIVTQNEVYLTAAQW